MEFEPGRKFQIDWEVGNTRTKVELKMMQTAKEMASLGMQVGTCLLNGRRRVYWSLPPHYDHTIVSRHGPVVFLNEEFAHHYTIEFPPEEFMPMLKEAAP